MTTNQKELTIPGIDFKNVGALSTDELGDNIIKELGCQLLEDAKYCGMVLLQNHGLPLDFLEECNTACSEFFGLPDDIKVKYLRSSTNFQGYTNPKVESIDNPNNCTLKETFNVTHLKNLFPDEVPAIKKASIKSLQRLEPFSQMILMMLEAGLGLSKGTLLKKHDPIMNDATTLKVLRYPAIHESISVGTIRCDPHCDITTFTLQFQFNVGGFQIEHENEWKAADVDSNSIICFFGRSFEYFTGRKFKAIKHRVIFTGEENQRKYDRKSIAFFIHPDPKEVLSNQISPDDKQSIVSRELLDPKWLMEI